MRGYILWKWWVYYLKSTNLISTLYFYQTWWCCYKMKSWILYLAAGNKSSMNLGQVRLTESFIRWATFQSSMIIICSCMKYVGLEPENFVFCITKSFWNKFFYYISFLRRAERTHPLSTLHLNPATRWVVVRRESDTYERIWPLWLVKGRLLLARLTHTRVAGHQPITSTLLWSAEIWLQTHPAVC